MGWYWLFVPGQEMDFWKRFYTLSKQLWYKLLLFPSIRYFADSALSELTGSAHWPDSSVSDAAFVVLSVAQVTW